MLWHSQIQGRETRIQSDPSFHTKRASELVKSIIAGHDFHLLNPNPRTETGGQ